MSATYTTSETFTVTQARHLAAKVATDLKRIQRFYGSPTDAQIADYEAEAITFLKHGYLASVTYGFTRNNLWIEPTLRYTARDLADQQASDDDPGRIRPSANVTGAAFSSFLTYSTTWTYATGAERDAFKKNLPFERGVGNDFGVHGYLTADRTYSAGGRALDRAALRSS